MASLIIHLFGPLHVLVADELMPRGRTRAVEWLLALLTLREGRAVDRTWLAGTLWPDSEEGRALHNLRTALMHLRKALGPQAYRLQSPTRDTLTLDLKEAEVDVLLFDRAIRAGDDASLQRAVAVYTGPLLEGCYEEWAPPEREARAAQCLAALEGLAERTLARGEPGAAVRFLRRAETLDPLRESAIRRLMACLAADGDLVAAGETYRRFRQRLYEAAAAPPDRETVLLYQQIRTRSREAARPQPHATARAALSVPEPGEPPASTAPLLRPPHPLAPLIGRETEVETVLEQLRQHRLVTLTGAGGVGKTRLALEVAGLVPGDVVWVELASLTEGALLVTTLAAALALRTDGASDAGTLLGRVVDRLSEGACLLVLDNCEHLVEAAARVTQDLLARCPDLGVLTTSRKRLGLTGEMTWRVPSLSCPPESGTEPPSDSTPAMPENRARSLPPATGSPGAARQAISPGALDYPAVRLFVERAASVRPGFHLAGSEDLEAVCRICRRLDGIPLALELAAARANVLTVRQIASRLDDRFRLLVGGSRAAAPRHQTLQAMIDWCYYQLSESEQTLLRRLSVFAGGWTLEAAEQVGAEPADMEPRLSGSPALVPIADWQVLDLLASLEDRSLVLVEETAAGLRYRMLETVREYGREKLRAAGEERAVRERHAEHYLTLAEQAQHFMPQSEPAWLERLEIEHDNLRAALAVLGGQEATVERAVRLAAALAWFWNTRGHVFEQRTWLVGLANRPTAPTETRAHLLSHAGWVVAQDGESALAHQMFSERLEIWRQLGDRWGVADALIGLAGLISDRALAASGFDPDRARELAEEGLAIMRELCHRQGIGQGCYVLGRLARLVGDVDAARTFWSECRAIDHAMGVKGGHVLPMLAELALESGDTIVAERHFQIFLSECLETGYRFGQSWALRGLGAVARAKAQPERAATLLGASLTLREAGGLSAEERAFYQEQRDALREALGERTLDAAWEAGKALPCEQAVAYGFDTAHI